MSFRSLHILLDADGTLLDWGAQWDAVLDELYPHFPNIPRTLNQRSFNLKLNLSEEEAAAVDEIFNHPGFYGRLKPIPGAQEAVAKMVEKGHHVQVATSPWWDNPTCLQDKSDSLAKFFGEDIRRTAHFGSDKTILRADYLFDDKPEIKGKYRPEWTQILYDQPYNRDIDLHRIFSWDDWEAKIEQIEEEWVEQYQYLL
jgi:5'-nucleotidase